MLSEISSSATTLTSPVANSRRTFSIAMIGSAMSETSGRAARHATRCGLLVGLSGDDPLAFVEAGPDLDCRAVVESGLDLALADVTPPIEGADGIAAVGFPDQRERGDDLHALGLAGDDVHLGGHVGPQRELGVGDVENADVVDGGAGGTR